MHHEHDGDTVGIEVLCNVRDDVSQASESSNAGTGKNSNHTDDGGKHNAGACDAEAAVLSNVDQVGDETGLLQAFSKEGSNEDQADVLPMPLNMEKDRSKDFLASLLTRRSTRKQTNQERNMAVATFIVMVL